MRRCARCGGRCLLLDGEMSCINCSRPCAPVVSTVPYEARGADDIVASIRRERRFIDAQIAAGKLAWS